MELLFWHWDELNFRGILPRTSGEFDFSLINKNIKEVARHFCVGSADDFKWGTWLEESYIKYYKVSYENCPYDWLDVKPAFPISVEIDFQTWVRKNVNYPDKARVNGIQGQVEVLYTVNREGKIEDVRILKSCYPLLDNEVVRVISQSPQWIPGKFKEIPVPVTYVHKHTFKI